MTTDYKPINAHPDSVDGLADRSRQITRPDEPRLQLVISNAEPPQAELDRMTETYQRDEPTLYQMQLEAYKQEVLDRIRQDNLRHHSRVMMDLMAQVVEHACNMHPTIRQTFADLPYWPHIEEYAKAPPHRRTALLERQVKDLHEQQHEALRKLKAVAAEMREGA